MATTVKEQIAVMQAHLDGKQIWRRAWQHDYHGSPWAIDHDPVWDWSTYDYKVVSKPEEWWIHVYPVGGCFAYTSREDAEQATFPGLLRCVHVREVRES